MKISIITPSYNQESFISKTIESVIQQNGNFDLEYIIIDGKSTDKSVEIIKKYANQDLRIKWLSEPDKGQSDAINKGFNMATGDIIGWLNSDDLYNKNSLQKVVDYFENNQEKKWFFGKCKIIDKNDKEVRKLITKYKNYFLKKYSYKKLLAENFISQPTVFWKKQIFEEIGYLNLNEHYCMDYEYWLRIGQKNNPGFINEYLSSFRYYSNSKSGSVDKKQFQDELRLAKKYGKNFPVSIMLHKINYWKITLIYKILFYANA